MFELTRRQLLQTGVAGLCTVPFLAEAKAEEPQPKLDIPTTITTKVVDILIGTHFQLEQVEVTQWYENCDEKTYIGNKEMMLDENHKPFPPAAASSNRLYYDCTDAQVHKSRHGGYDIYLRIDGFRSVYGTPRDSVIVMTGFQEVKLGDTNELGVDK